MSLLHLDGSGSVAPVQFVPPQESAILVPSVITCFILGALAAGLLLLGGKRKG